jgi:two-component system sensor histidine kinase/response regulator
VLECRFKDSASTAENCPIARVLGGESLVPSGQMELRCRDKSYKPVEYRCVPYPMLTGLGAILAFRDLTGQMDLEKDIRRLASIAEESPIPIVELNEDANPIYANPAMMSLMERFGFSSDARPLVLPANIVMLTAKCLHRQKEVAGIDVSVGGNHYEWKLVPVIRERLVRGYGIDLTARKRAEIELTQAKAKAEVASQTKSKFLDNMSEEIGAPIRDILRRTDLLAESGLTNQQMESIKNIKSCSKSLMTSIDDILAMAALETKNIKVEKTRFDFRTFMGKTVAAFVPRAEEKGLQLTVTISNQVPQQVYCDSNRLGQLLHNLLTNAIKFTERGEVVVEVDRDTISTRPAVGNEDNKNNFYLFFIIRDTGIGISKEKQEAMFDRFAQPGDSSNSPDDGAGWGLAISKHLVELLGGTIDIESEPGKGSKFWFSLPLREDLGKSGK